jgi:hypothetical protein
VDGGATWVDASVHYRAGRTYNGVLASGSGNPAAGSPAFVGASHGFVSTRYDLNGIGGHAVRFRFRNTSDASVRSGLSWAVDEFRIYTCATDSTENQAPAALGGADQTVSPGAQVTLDGSASVDPDGQIAEGQWTQVSGSFVQVTQASGRRLVFTAPTTSVQESLVFRLTVTDNRGAVSTDDVTVTVVNQQPVANAGAGQARKPRDTVLLQGAGTDSDGTITRYSWTQISGPAAGLDKRFNLPLQNATPQGLWVSTTPYTVGASFLFLNFAPGVLSNLGGNVQLRPGSEFSTCLVITGNACSSRHSLALTGTVSAPAAADIAQPATWTLQAMASDGTVVSGTFVFNASTLALSGVQIVSGHPESQVLSFTAPSVPGSAVLQFRLTVTDNRGGTGTGDVNVTVTNLQPAVNAGADVSTRPRLTVPLLATATDPDGTISSIAWSQVSGPTATLSNPGSVNAGLVAPSVVANGTLVFRVVATDSDGATASDEIFVTVSNSAPVANAGIDKTAKAGATVNLPATGTDSDGTISSYSWIQTGGPSVALTGAMTSSARFTAPSADVASTVSFQVTVTDNDGATALDQVAVNVSAKDSSGGGGGGGGSVDLLLLAALLGLGIARGICHRVAARALRPALISGISVLETVYSDTPSGEVTCPIPCPTASVSILPAATTTRSCWPGTSASGSTAWSARTSRNTASPRAGSVPRSARRWIAAASP